MSSSTSQLTRKQKKEKRKKQIAKMGFFSVPQIGADVLEKKVECEMTIPIFTMKRGGLKQIGELIKTLLINPNSGDEEISTKFVPFNNFSVDPNEKKKMTVMVDPIKEISMFLDDRRIENILSQISSYYLINIDEAVCMHNDLQICFPFTQCIREEDGTFKETKSELCFDLCNDGCFEFNFMTVKMLSIYKAEIGHC